MPRILLYTTLLTLSAWSANGAEVCLKPDAICRGGIVRLKDVAEVSSADEVDANALAELALFPVPGAGKTRHVRAGEIRELLSLSGVNLNSVTLSGAEKITIRRQETKPVANSPAAHGGISEVVPSSLITPATKVAGRSGEGTGIELVPLAVRALQRGEVLRESDLELRPAKQSALGKSPATIAELVGKELLRPLSAGQSVTADSVQSHRLVHRGDKVTVKAIAAGVVVTTTGKALEEGGSGDNVLVEESGTKEKLVTRVAGFQAVEVLGTGVKSVR